MNLPRLRELHAAWRDGSIRTDELMELRDMLPEVIEVLEMAEPPTHDKAMAEAERVLSQFVPVDHPMRNGPNSAGYAMVQIMIAMGVRRECRVL